MTLDTLPIGINIDGVLDHDGLPDPTPDERFARVAASGVFDFIEKNLVVGEKLDAYEERVARHGVPIGVLGGIFCAGRDEARARYGAAWAGRLGARLYNCQLFARHADGHALDDREVADFYLRLLDWGSAAGVLPSLEVHVDMWNEDPRRVERVADLLAAGHVRLRITLDLAHLLYRVGNADELRVAGIADAVDAGELVIDPDAPGTVHALWLREGWVVHGHARSVALGGPVNAWARRGDGRPGRAIQYPFVEPPAGAFHADWDAARLEPWKRATRAQLAWARSQPPAERAMRQFACEFLPFADCGGGSRYSVWDNNVACAAWLREQWAALGEVTTGG